MPATLYKYRSLSGESFKFTQDIFLRRRIFLSPVARLNDPCETLFSYETPSGEEPNPWMRYAEGQDRFGLFHSTSVFCVTETPTNPLMWAHYADSHRGICIGFNASPPSVLGRARRVTYSSTLPVVAFSQSRDDRLPEVALSKSEDWEYESEWRLLGAKGESFVAISDRDVESIVFGANVSEADRDWVQDWVQLYNPAVKLFKARFSASRYEMELIPYVRP